MCLESCLKGFGQGDNAVFAAFPIVNGDGALSEIEVFDTDSHGLHETETAAVHDLGA